MFYRDPNTPIVAQVSDLVSIRYYAHKKKTFRTRKTKYVKLNFHLYRLKIFI